jgi:hypothetical protein
MNKRVLFSFAALMVLLSPALAQDKKPQNCSGTISDDGQSFTCEKDHHVWKVSNPMVLSGMEGQYAKLTFKHTSEKDEVLVTAASTVQQPTVAHNPGDSAFRR